MKKIRYIVAMSLDGYIAGPKGEADWITMDPEVDFAALWAQFDTFLMGRRTYEAAVSRLGASALRGKKAFVASRRMAPEAHAGITILPTVDSKVMQALRDQAEKDIWLFGGGELFRVLVELREVDTVEVNLIPMLLGEGVPLLPGPGLRVGMELVEHRAYRSGRVSLVYAVRK